MKTHTTHSNRFKLALLVGVFISGMSIFSTGASAASSSGSSGRKVLLTSFGPWGDKLANSSQPVAVRAKELLESQGYRVEICSVPVLWGESAKSILNCYNQLPEKPDLVVSFGVGRSEHVASGAKNLNKAKQSDVSGLKIKSAPIDREQPDFLDFKLPGGLAFKEAVKLSGTNLPVKKNAGTFICNDVAFRVGAVMASEEVPYLFMHVEDAFNPKILKSKRLTKDQMVERSASRAASLIHTIFASVGATN